MRLPTKPIGTRFIAIGVALASVASVAALLTPAHAATACPWMNTSQSPETRATELLGAMSLDDKIHLVTSIGLYSPAAPSKDSEANVTGNPRLCIPNLVMNDGSGGIAFDQKYTTAFPQAISQASTWNASLIRNYGGVLADEALRKGVNVILGPGLNLERNPLNGRGFEYMGEDPYLTGQLGADLIRGIQSRPVLAVAKHYILNEQETNRQFDSSNVDPRTFHELYLTPFEDAVKAGVASVMCSYNRINDVYACQSRNALAALKQTLGFKGFVMSDAGALYSGIPEANAGLDMEMPGGSYSGTTQIAAAKWGSNLKAAVQSGTVSRQRLDDMVRRILLVMFRGGLFNHRLPSGAAADDAVATTSASLVTATAIAQQGSVLLKNSRVLPLTGRDKRIAVIGAPASKSGAELAEQGFGSNHVPFAGLDAKVVAPLAALTARAAKNGAHVVYSSGTVPALAALTAQSADVAIVFVADASTEGTDRTDLRPHQASCNPSSNIALIPLGPTACFETSSSQDALVSAVARANPNTIVVLQNGGPVEMPWLGSVKGIVENWYPGQVDGAAIAHLLFGDANFSGKLPVTFPKKLADGPLRSVGQYPGVNNVAGIPQSQYSERLLIGYRWYNAKRIVPLFPFGFGLSYTAFRFSGLTVQRDATGATATFRVTNTGSRSGAEVAQVYLSFPTTAGEPPVQLRAFTRLQLAAGQTRTTSLRLDRRAFSIWTRAGWRVRPGCYTIRVGDSSANLPLRARIGRAGGTCRA